jgi:hypothetical protein
VIRLKPIFVDIHIHTSENPNKINENYNIDELITNVKKVCGNADYLIALSDHNTINKKAYLELVEKAPHALLSVELHIKNYKERPPYHCHIIFNIKEINEIIIDKINSILDEIYPNKEISDDTDNVPEIEDIVRKFDEYEFLLLPHGGQSHKTFDKSIPKGVVFDSTLERSIYYNQFDGFTARSNLGLEETKRYFKRLGISEFVNLLTCSDNYNSYLYPQAKASDAEKFLPTWMYASPTFEGLRISLSEVSRFVYSDNRPNDWAEYINYVKLVNDKINLDVHLTPGLNVVIGGSSSGKTLFVDSIYNKINNNFSESKYIDFNVQCIEIINPSGLKPHYINQNFIMSILSNEDKGLNDIEILNKVFPLDKEIDNQVRLSLADLKRDMGNLISSIKMIDSLNEDLLRIPILSHLILEKDLRENIIDIFMPSEQKKQLCSFTKDLYEEYKNKLYEIEIFLTNNPFSNDMSIEFNKINEEIDRVYQISQIHTIVFQEIKRLKEQVDEELKSENLELQTKKENRDKLLSLVSNYIENLTKFHLSLDKISKYNITCKTNTIEVAGHKLSIENKFELSKEKILEVLNKYLKKELRITLFDEIEPHKLFIDKFSKKSPKVDSYENLESLIFSDFEKMNKKSYKIVTSSGQDFENISPGWKSAVLLDIILGYDKDLAPLIIDQPEDNLATNYINTGLIRSIKNIKTKKQIILVSHNATIPMLGDAQNIILCRNESGLIDIKSQPLEGNINGKSMVDYIAEITDGGKPSIKKRVKKYDLKSFREDV